MKKKAFTLIEMLIVIVVIGILSSALIPRFQSAQARSRDLVRVNDLRKVYTALQSYYLDKGKYPSASMNCNSPSRSLSVISGELVPYLLSLPQDPGGGKYQNMVGGKRTFDSFFCIFGGTGEYIYFPLHHQNPEGFVLVAPLETYTYANWVTVNSGNRVPSTVSWYNNPNPPYQPLTRPQDIIPCSRVESGTGMVNANNGSVCTHSSTVGTKNKYYIIVGMKP